MFSMYAGCSASEFGLSTEGVVEGMCMCACGRFECVPSSLPFQGEPGALGCFPQHLGLHRSREHGKTMTKQDNGYIKVYLKYPISLESVLPLVVSVLARLRLARREPVLRRVDHDWAPREPQHEKLAHDGARQGPRQFSLNSCFYEGSSTPKGSIELHRGRAPRAACAIAVCELLRGLP